MRLFAVILAGVLVFLQPRPAAADSFEIETAGLGALGGPSFLTPFDPTLGTLTSVDVSIIGAVTADILTQVTIGGPGVFIPTPFSVGLDQSFQGTGGFTFFQPGTFVFNGVGSGEGEVQTLVQPFDYEFTFNSLSNLTGFTDVGALGPLIPPIWADGNFASFTKNFLPFIDELEILQPSTTFPSVGGTIIDWSNQGGIKVTYNYTPASSPVDEPTTLLLMATGLVCLAALLRRTATAR